MTIPMLNPTATQRLALVGALLLSLLWQLGQSKGSEPSREPQETAAAESASESASPNLAEGIPTSASPDEPPAGGQLSEASAASHLSEVPDEQGQAGEARGLEEIGKYESQTDDSPAAQPPSVPRQQALVTFPAPLRLNTTPNTGGIFRWSKALRTDPDEDRPIPATAASKSLFSQSGSGNAARVKPPVAKPKALLPVGLLSSSGPAGRAAPVSSSNSNRRSLPVTATNPQSARPAEIKRSKALFNGSLFSMIEPEQSSATTTASAQQPKALLPGPTVTNSQSATVPAVMPPTPAPQSRAILSGTTRLPPAVEHPKALFTGSPVAYGPVTPVGNGQPVGAAPTSAPPMGNQPKALFSGTFLAKRVEPSSVAGSTPIAAPTEAPQSKALFPVLAKSTPTPAIPPAPASVPTLAVPKVTAPRVATPTEDEYDTQLARSMMKGNMPLHDEASSQPGSASSRRPGRQLLDEAHEPAVDAVAPSEQTVAPAPLEEPAVAESKLGGWRSRAVTDERRSLADSPTFKISKPPDMLLKQWTLADSATIDKPLKPIPPKSAKNEKAIVIPVVREQEAVARSSTDAAKSLVQAANAQEPASSADKPESSQGAASLTIVPGESERATELNPTSVPTTTSPFRKNPLR